MADKEPKRYPIETLQDFLKVPPIGWTAAWPISSGAAGVWRCRGLVFPFDF